MGIPKSEWPADMRSEHGIFNTVLRKHDKEELCRRNVAIAVAVGTKDAADRLQGVAKQLGLQKFLGLRHTAALTANSIETDSPLTTFLEEVGREVIAWARYGKTYSEVGEHDRDDCSRDALGYHRAGGLTATVFNVPVSTCTALWCPGVFRKEPWVPLLIRRGYLDKLVLG